MTPEGRVKRDLNAYFKKVGALVVPQVAGPMRTAGVSDLLVCYRGWFIAFEVKRPGGKPTPTQLRFLDRVRAAEGLGYVVSSVAEVERILTAIGPCLTA